jgi:MtN3 and saliva related transmembrane protein
MSMENWAGMLGAVAGTCTTLAFVPQVVKIWKQGGRDLSYGLLGVYLVGVLLWLAYGLLLRAPEIVLANAATALLVLLATVLKAWTDKRLAPGQSPRRRLAE